MERLPLLLIAFLGFCPFSAAQNQAVSLPGYTVPPYAYLDVPNAAGLLSPTGLTVEAWVYPNGSPAANATQAIVQRRDSNGDSSLNFFLNGSNPAFQVRTPSGLYGALSAASVPFMQWTHLAATFDNAVARIYQDGVPVAEVAAAGPIIDLGGYFTIGTPPLWNGQLDSLRIWSHARTQSEIEAGMRYQLEDRYGLLASWNFDGDYLDSTGSHHAVPGGPAALVAGTAPLLPALNAPLQVMPGGQLAYRVSAVSMPVTYVLELSISGTSPGIALPSPLTGVFPLNPPLLASVFAPVYPASFHDFTGTTGPSGAAFPSLDIPFAPSLAGIALSAAFVTIDAAGPHGIGTVSNAVTTGVAAPPPSIATITPSTAPTTGGTSVTVTGNGFLPGAIVSFGGVPSPSTNVSSATTIVCVAPPGLLGAASVTVLNPEFSEAVATGLFSYVSVLALVSVSPQVGQAGSQVTLIGSGFQQGLSMTIDGSPTALVSVTPSSVVFLRPAAVSCNASLVVTNPDGQTASIAFNASATVTDVIPGFGLASGGNPVFLIGSGFVPGTAVAVSGQPATVLSTSPTGLIFVTPAGSPGVADVSVTLPSGCTAIAHYLYL